MPFEIEKGYGENEIKKSVPHPIVRESDMVYISPPADLAELLNFKVYHISNKKKGSGKVQKRLVGEHYLRENEKLGSVKKAKAKDVLDATSSELQTIGHVKLSNLLRKIRKLKVKKYSEQEHQKNILERLQLSSAEPRAISVGKHIFQGLEERTLNETINWAFEYIDAHSDTLSTTLFGVVDELRVYAAWKEKNRLLKAGVAVSTQNTPRRKIAILQTDTGGNQFETAHLPFRRPKNISLLDQLNRIDMIGFNRFLDMIGGKNPEQSPPKQRPGWPNAPHSQSPRSPRRPSVSNPKRPSISAPNQSSQRHSPLGFAPDDESIQKPPSSIAGTYGSSGAASSYHPVKEHSAHIQQNSLQKNSASSKNNHVQRSPEKPKSAQQTQPIHRIIEPKPPSAPSKFGKRNHRKSVLVPSHGLETPILTDDDTALLVKVDRRDSNHKVNLPNQPPGQRWGTQTNTTEVTSRADEDEEDKEKDSDLLSDFGSLHYQGGKAATYSNNVDALTTNWDSLQLYKFNSDFNANEIQDTKIRAYYQRGLLRDELLKNKQNHTNATINKVEVSTEHLVNVWEEISNIDSIEFKKMTAILNQKDFNRTDFIKTLQDCFLMDGNDPKLGRLGSTLMVDLLSMKRKAKHRIYCRKMEHLSKAVWFTTILVKLKEHTKKSFQKVPPSLYKFLSVIHVILMYGWSLSVELFWSLMEKTIEPQDQKEIVVHRTIKAIREYLKISPEVFMQYLDSHGIQPCSELLAQIREIKQKKTRAARAQQLKQRVIGMYSPRIKATLQKSLQVDVQSTDEPNISSLPNQKYLSMIREQSESTNYGIEYNSLTPMRKEIGAKKVMFAPNMSDMVEESSEIHFDEGYDGYDDQLSPLGSIMSLETENPETIEIQIPKKS